MRERRREGATGRLVRRETCYLTALFLSAHFLRRGRRENERQKIIKGRDREVAANFDQKIAVEAASQWLLINERKMRFSSLLLLLPRQLFGAAR